LQDDGILTIVGKNTGGSAAAGIFSLKDAL